MPQLNPRPVNPTVHLPEEGTYYYRTFWGAYKGHVMGMMRGTVIGAVIGAAIGLTFAAVFATAAAPLLPIVAAITATAAMMGAASFGSVGYAAGAAAAATAEEEIRLRYPGSGDGTAQSPDSPSPGFGHHYETPPDRDKGKWFHWDLGVPMMAVGLGIGGLFAYAIGAGALLPALHLASHATIGGVGIAHAVGASLPALGGLLGISYGIDRARFKDVFNVTDKLVSGSLKRTGSEPSPLQGMEQELTQEAAAGKAAPTITTLERQDEHHRLFYDYFERSFWGGISGRFKGFMGGPVVGGAIGAALGSAAFLIPGLNIATAAAFAVGLTAFGAHEGLNIFTSAGTDAGAQAAAREILEVKRQRLQKGLDPEQEPETAAPGRLFNPRAAIVGIVIGALVGAALFPLMGPMLVTALGGSAVLPAILGSVSLELASSVVIGGLVGSTYGIGTPVLQGMSHLADSIYDGRILQGKVLPEHEGRKIPYLAPNSPWVPRDVALQKAAESFTIPVPQNPYYMNTMALAQATASKSEPVNAHPALVPTAETAPAAEEPTRPANYPSHKPMGERIQHILQTRGPLHHESAIPATVREEQRRSAQSSPQVDPGMSI